MNRRRQTTRDSASPLMENQSGHSESQKGQRSGVITFRQKVATVQFCDWANSTGHVYTHGAFLQQEEEEQQQQPWGGWGGSRVQILTLTGNLDPMQYQLFDEDGLDHIVSMQNSTGEESLRLYAVTQT